jgi:SAM-dependent methyltransferase
MMSLSEIRGLAAVVDAAERAGILAALSSRALTHEEIAAELGLDEAATSRVMEVLVAWELVAREGERHRLAPHARRELAGPHGLPGAASRVWDRTLEFLRGGRDHALLANTPRGDVYAGVVAHLSRWCEPAAARLADHLAPALESVASPHILDVGAGGGVWSLALLERCPRARATGLDLAPVVPVYAEAARARGLEHRVSTIATDFHQAVLPVRAFDVVIAAGVLHLEAPTAAEALIARVSRSVAPGGLFLAVDVLSDGSSHDERSRAVYAMHLAIRVPTGYPHREDALRDWMSAAGLDVVSRVRLSDEIRGLSALLARPRAVEGASR